MFCNTCKSTLLHIFLETAVLQKKNCRLPPTYKFELGISWFSINHRNIDNYFSYEKVTCLKWVLRKRRYTENLLLIYVVRRVILVYRPHSLEGRDLSFCMPVQRWDSSKVTELVWKAKSSTGDYHDEMNGDNFFKWVKEKLIPHLPPKSVLIIDNAPYHNLKVDKCPTQASRKADKQAWLTRQQIHFGATLLKAELLQICKQHKPTPSFLLDNILKEYGHDCLRPPAPCLPCRPQFDRADLGNDERILRQTKCKF